jgi:hypothetical protein
MESFGNILSDIIDNAMQMLKPVTNYVETYAAMWERILDVKPMEMRNPVRFEGNKKAGASMLRPVAIASSFV